MDKQDTGLLLNPNNIKIHRQYFSEMTKLLGIQVLYKAPRENKVFNTYGELESSYCEPIKVGCIFDEHPKQWTMKKLGWDSELSDELSIIHVPYDLPRLQVGALFIIPSGIDNSDGRTFKVLRMSTTMIYPASISCELGPVIEDSFEKSQLNHDDNNFDLLATED